MLQCISKLYSILKFLLLPAYKQLQKFFLEPKFVYSIGVIILKAGALLRGFTVLTNPSIHLPARNLPTQLSTQPANRPPHKQVLFHKSEDLFKRVRLKREKRFMAKMNWRSGHGNFLLLPSAIYYFFWLCLRSLPLVIQALMA